MNAKIAIVAAMERELKALVRDWRIAEREHGGRRFRFFESDNSVLVVGGIGAEPARRAAEAIIYLYSPGLIVSAGFAGALDISLRVGDSFIPGRVIDAGDGSVTETGIGSGILVSSYSVSTAEQKRKLAAAYGAQAVDMEGAAVARAAKAHGIGFVSVKAISDELSFDMPDLNPFVRNGEFQTARFVAHAIVRPHLWGIALRMAKNSSKAAGTLSRALEQYNRHPEFLENVSAGLHLNQ